VRTRHTHSLYASLSRLFALTTLALGVLQVASLNTRFSDEFARQTFANFTVNGVAAGIYKNAGTFSYVRFFGAGHEVPAYMSPGVPRGAAALQMFTQIMSGEQLTGT
jgi:hypothetical protein